GSPQHRGSVQLTDQRIAPDHAATPDCGIAVPHSAVAPDDAIAPYDTIAPDHAKRPRRIVVEDLIAPDDAVAPNDALPPRQSLARDRRLAIDAARQPRRTDRPTRIEAFGERDRARSVHRAGALRQCIDIGQRNRRVLENGLYGVGRQVRTGEIRPA